METQDINWVLNNMEETDEAINSMLQRLNIHSDDLKIILKGAIGSMTFGAYHMYITTNMINENNRNNEIKIKNKSFIVPVPAQKTCSASYIFRSKSNS